MSDNYQSDLTESNILSVANRCACKIPLSSLDDVESSDSLLYHSEVNSNEIEEKKGYKPTNEQAKTFKVLDSNTKDWVKRYGVENIGFLTLTFKENLTDMKEAQRRWNSLNSMIRKENKFQILVKIIEPQKRGAVHYHLLIKTNKSIKNPLIKGGIDWDIYEQMGKTKTAKEKRQLGRSLGKSAAVELIELWSWLRIKCKSTGFGRHELMPIKKTDHIKNYLGKYLEKDMQENSLKVNGKNKRKRLITYGRNITKVANKKFSWVSGNASIFRRKLKIYCESRGIKAEKHRTRINPKTNQREIIETLSYQDQLVEKFGKSWSFILYKEIMNDRVLGAYKDKQWNELQNPDERNTMLYPWGGSCHSLHSATFTDSNLKTISDQYLTEDNHHADRQMRSVTDEREHFRKWKVFSDLDQKHAQSTL